MSFILKYFTIDITPGALPPVVHVSEYDTGRQYGVTITDGNGPFSIPLGATATVEGTLNGTIGFTASATIANGNVMFQLTESMTAQSGRAWVKIKIVKDGEPVSTAAFILAVDRAGVEAGTVIGASGFYNQIAAAVDAWLEENAQNGIPTAVKTALLNCFENVAWIGDDGQDYYNALHDALYPQVLDSITAVFTQGSAVIYDTDSLDDLKQYLVVTAQYTDQTSETLEDTDYTLSGTLTEGTSVITVSYGGETTTFNVTVTESPLLPAAYQQVEYIGSSGSQYILLNNVVSDFKTDGWVVTMVVQTNGQAANTSGGLFAHGENIGYWWGLYGSVYGQNGTSVESPCEGSASWNSSGMTTVTSSKTYSVNYSGSAPTHKNICLFGIPNAAGTSATYKASAKLYSMVISKGGNEFMNLIPCYRKSDSVVGLYDIIGEQFLTNNGSGAFTKGADV